MRYDVLMFVAMLTVLAASGVHALLPPQRPIVVEPQPVSERVALLERDYEYLSRALKELRDEMRLEMEEIKTLLEKHTNKVERWIVIVLGLLVTGDRGWAILQRFKNKGEAKC